MESRATKQDSHNQRSWREILRTVRAAERWEFKLGPILAIIYATAFLLGLSIISLWPVALIVMVALTAFAVYVSVINDFTDRADDMASGKTNRLVGKSLTFIATVLAVCILSGVVVATYWRHEPLLLLLYFTSWAVFTLYSFPPIRLKKRGGWGVLADACGAHLFPTLLAAAAVYRWTQRPFDAIWFVSIGVWALSFGIRGILWHQLNDLPHDKRIDLQTFARTHKTRSLQRLGNFIIFPIELAAFALMLWRTRCVIAITFVGLYALLNLFRKRFFGSSFCVAMPKSEFHHIVMHEYYEVLFPLAFILASANQHPLDLVVLVVHGLLFPKRWKATAMEIALILRALWRVARSKRSAT